MSRIPDLPGVPIPHRSDQEKWLKQTVARLCQLENERFPGSQPVSFAMPDLQKLDTKDYWVCEKSDGVRVLLFVYTDITTSEQMVFLIDRHNSYRELSGFYFPHFEDPRKPLRSTIVDAIAVARDHPFHIKVKQVKLSYHVDDVFNIDLPALHHGNDGLIYTCAETPYIPGTDTNILKWKPPSENSIDFKLVLRFPPLSIRSPDPDFHAKPVFELHVYCGDERGLPNERGTPRYEFYDVMHVEDEEWESLKRSGEQLDDRIVEVHWDPTRERWRMMRFRDDKPAGNYKTVVEAIIKSIADGVEKDQYTQLLARSAFIRNAWKSSAHPPPPANGHAPPANSPQAEPRYGPLAQSPWSKVSGPDMIAGMYR
ncbi:hypothetical protein EVJ58_g6686 [Rhodofomes roseus]|uniref:mRNA guanylyltransferase n=1 Tax=Rhodofomes roseus TaxID=34475 RepID=A0A4Y9Y7V1_9APHY|nr:hypothetical protein EVJ58_g6686 [Rhodofomes roseus]